MGGGGGGGGSNTLLYELNVLYGRDYFEGV